MLKFVICLSFFCNSYAGKDKSTTPSDSSRLPSEVTAAPQESPNYVVVGVSVGVGILVLVIVALIIRKCLCKTRIFSAKQQVNTGNVNACLEGDFELSTMPRKM